MNIYCRKKMAIGEKYRHTKTDWATKTSSFGRSRKLPDSINEFGIKY